MKIMVRLSFLLLAALLLPAPSSFAETWTNVAGRAIQAELVGGSAGFVVLKKTDGSRFRMSVKSLCPADQVRAAARLKPASEEAEAGHTGRGGAEQLEKRAFQLRDAGLLDDNEFDMIIEALKKGDSGKTPGKNAAAK